MIVKFNIEFGTVAEYKLDAPPRVDEYVILNLDGTNLPYKVTSIINTYPMRGRTLATMTMAKVIVQLRYLTKEEEEHVKLSRPD
jgi:hypothetical protein